MRTIDNLHNYVRPGSKAPLPPRLLTVPQPAPTRQQRLRARFRDEEVRTVATLQNMNEAARRMWGRS